MMDEYLMRGASSTIEKPILKIIDKYFPGEKLVAALYGTTPTIRKPGIHIQFPVGVCYIGLTDESIIFIRHSMFGYLIAKEKIRFNGLSSISVRKGMITDSIYFDKPKQGNDRLKVIVPWRYRSQMKAILTELSEIVNMQKHEKVGFRQWLSEIDSIYLVMGPYLMSFLIYLLSVLLRNTIYHGTLPGWLNTLTLNAILFLWGLSGIGIVIKRELPPMTFVSISGKPAIILGALMTVFWWTLLLIFLLP